MLDCTTGNGKIEMHKSALFELAGTLSWIQCPYIHRMKTRLTLSLCLATVCVAWAAETTTREQILSQLENAPKHPRLFWTHKDEAAVREKIKSDAQMKSVWEGVLATADHMLKEKPVVYRKDGRRLLGRSREALGRTMHLGFAYRITGDNKYAERAFAEMKAMAEMQDWNPSHFLDTAEMSLAMAVAYDWLYDKLPADLKATAREAIVKKGLDPYLKAEKRHGWERGGNNWNQVCHAGMVGGALALLEDDPPRAAEVVHRAIQGLPAAMKVYNPDGTYPEGPGYWNYGTSFNVMLINMFESVFNTDFGLSSSPGFLKSGEFMVHIIGPSRRTYNFSDCGNATGFSPAMAWFAARTGREDLMWFENEFLADKVAHIRGSRGAVQGERYFPLVLIWARHGFEKKHPSELNWLGQGQNPIAVLRSSWTDPKGVYVAIKAGTPSASHGHMDIGSFVMDADGTRWSLDLGMQDYNGLEQRGIALWDARQGAERWKIFRYHNRGHSTLLVNDEEQVVASKAPVSEFSAHPNQAHAVVDMTETYRGQLASAKRRFTLQPDHRVVIEDEITGGTDAATVRWGMVTPATLQKNGIGAGWLVNGEKRLKLEVLSPARMVLESWPASEPVRSFDAPNPGVSVVGFKAPVKPGEKVTFKVALVPETTGKN